MSMDSNLFKEAIADAKAVRQTALANAKVALEEAFTERYKQMFAEKLKEETEQEEPNAAPAEECGTMEGSAEENVSEAEIDELIKELENEVGEEPQGEPGGVPPAEGPSAGAGVPPSPLGAPMGAGAGAGAAGAPAVCPPGTIPCAGAPGGQPIPQAGGAAGAPPTGMPPIGGEVPQMGAPSGAPPSGGAVPPSPEGEEQTPPPSDSPAPGAQEEDEEFDLNELLESLKAEIGEEDETEEEEEDKKLDEQTKLTSSGIGSGKAGGSPNKKPSSAASSSSKIEDAANDDEGYPDTDQAKVVAKEASGANRPNKATHATKDNLSTPSFGGGNGGSSSGQSDIGYPKTDQAKVTAKEAGSASRPNQAKNATKDNLSTPGGMLEENKMLRKQVNEAEEVIRYVKTQLNEVNLLNAKLLYTNKLFKEFNMGNEHKMRVVELFDLAKNVREVKLTYANITESLNFGGSNVQKKSRTSPSVQAITEGLASGVVASTKPKEIISEGKFASRMKQLAGIRSGQKK